MFPREGNSGSPRGCNKVAIVNHCLPVSESLAIATVRVVICTRVRCCAEQAACRASSVVTSAWVGDWKSVCQSLEKVPLVHRMASLES